MISGIRDLKIFSKKHPILHGYCRYGANIISFCSIGVFFSPDSVAIYDDGKIIFYIDGVLSISNSCENELIIHTVCERDYILSFNLTGGINE